MHPIAANRIDMRHNTGFFIINRKLLQHELWLRDPFTRGQAWVDLIALANYTAGSIRVHGHTIEISRGQCGWSEVRLSERWKWSRSKTRRFLNELKCDAMITMKSYTKTTVITISNYDEYQAEHFEGDTTDDTTKKQLTIQRKDTNKEERINKTKEPPYPPRGEIGSGQLGLMELPPPKIPLPVSDRFIEFWEIYPKHADRAKALKAYQTAKAKASEETIITGARLYAAEREDDDRPESKRFTKNAATWLNGECWENYSDTPESQEDISGLSPDEKARRILAMAGLQ